MNKWKAVSYWLIVSFVIVMTILTALLVDANNEIDYRSKLEIYFAQKHSAEIVARTLFYERLLDNLQEKSKEQTREQARIIEILKQEKDSQAQIASDLAERNQGLEKLTDPFIYPQDIIGTVSGEELKKVLRKYYPGAQIKLWDEEYWIVSIEKLREFLEHDNTSSLAYIQPDGTATSAIPDYLDCDEPARRLVGNAIKYGILLGLVEGVRETPFGISENHAFNLFITRDQEGELVIYEIEPRHYLGIRKVERPVSQTFFILF